MVVKDNFKDRWTLNVDIILLSQSGKSVKSWINSMIHDLDEPLADDESVFTQPSEPTEAQSGDN